MITEEVKRNLISFIKNHLVERESYEILLMQHLKMSALYWALCSLRLLGEEIDGSMALDFVKTCRNADGGYGGDLGLDSHLFYTLSALQILKLVGNELSDVEIEATTLYVQSLEKEGVWMGDEWGEEDTRFSYCGILCLDLLGRLEQGISQRTLLHIKNCRNWDGGYAAMPGAESHGGQIFCCLAARKLAGDDFKEKLDQESLLCWLAMRQQSEDGGLNGRPMKHTDVCYSWWILASLSILGHTEVISKEALIKFILNSIDPDTGGIADRPGDIGDLFHTFFGIAGK